MIGILQERKTTLRLTTAQAIVKYLSAQYVQQLDGSFLPLLGGIFGIMGHGNVAGLGEALEDVEDTLPFYRGQNEQGMAHTAIGFAKACKRRRMMAVTSSIGPGATNMVTACALAHVNRLPVLFLPGDIYASRRPDPVLQQLEHPLSQQISVNDCFSPVSRYFDRITRPEQLLGCLPEAVRILLDPVECGPVTLSLPQDVQAEAYEYPVEFFEKKKHWIRRLGPDLKELELASQLLREAKRPLIIAGGGVHYSGAVETLLDFAEAYGIPFCETQAGKAVTSWRHPLNLGGLGVTGTSAANEMAQLADVVLAVGTRLSDFTTASKSLFPKAKIIGLNVQARDSHKLGAYPLVADAKCALGKLDAHVTCESYRQEIAETLARWRTSSDTQVQHLGGIPGDAHVLARVNAFAERKGPNTVVCAAGGLPGELHRHWRPSDQDGYHLEYGYSCMGYEIAAAIGVKMANPERDVWVLLGDGSYLMLHQELLSAQTMGLKLNIVLLDNGGFGCINRLQQACGGVRFGNLLQGQRVDFVANAKSYGCVSAKAENLEELDLLLEEMYDCENTSVIVIETNPELSSPGNAWWDVAVAETSPKETVRDARLEYEKKLRAL